MLNAIKSVFGTTKQAQSHIDNLVWSLPENTVLTPQEAAHIVRELREQHSSDEE